MSSGVVEFVEATKIYKKGNLSVPVFEKLNFEIPSGDFVAVMGPSGSGKTTILNLLAGFDRPTSGKVLVGGTDVSQLSESELGKWRLHNVGFVFQQFNLIHALKARENVEVPLRNLGVPSGPRRENVMRVLDIVGLSARAEHYPTEMSGGEEQRVAIARAIVSDPKLLVADEPTGNLDETSAGRVMEILRLLNTEQKKTIVVVTHDPNVASQAKRVLYLRKGVLENHDPKAPKSATSSAPVEES